MDKLTFRIGSLFDYGGVGGWWDMLKFTGALGLLSNSFAFPFYLVTNAPAEIGILFLVVGVVLCVVCSGGVQKHCAAALSVEWGVSEVAKQEIEQYQERTHGRKGWVRTTTILAVFAWLGGLIMVYTGVVSDAALEQRCGLAVGVLFWGSFILGFTAVMTFAVVGEKSLPWLGSALADYLLYEPDFEAIGIFESPAGPKPLRGSLLSLAVISLTFGIGGLSYFFPAVLMTGNGTAFEVGAELPDLPYHVEIAIRDNKINPEKTGFPKRETEPAEFLNPFGLVEENFRGTAKRVGKKQDTESSGNLIQWREPDIQTRRWRKMQIDRDRANIDITRAKRDLALFRERHPEVEVVWPKRVVYGSTLAWLKSGLSAASKGHEQARWLLVSLVGSVLLTGVVSTLVFFFLMTALLSIGIGKMFEIAQQGRESDLSGGPLINPEVAEAMYKAVRSGEDKEYLGGRFIGVSVVEDD